MECKVFVPRGRDVFIRAVLQVIRIYSMVCFLLLKSLCNEMESVMAKFLWQNGLGRKRIHQCSWAHLSESKEFGRMGFRSLAKFNVALLAKQGQRLINFPDSLLSRVSKAKYFPRSNFLNTSLGNLPSFTWRSVQSARGLLADDLYQRIGSGDNISIRDDAWLPRSPSYRLNKEVNLGGLNVVTNLIDNMEWKEALIRNTLSIGVVERILSIPLPLHRRNDILVWCGDPSREFTVNSVYKPLHKGTFRPNYTNYVLMKLYTKLWRLQIPTKVKITMWKATWTFLPILVNLQLKRVRGDGLCPRCGNNSESYITFLEIV